MSRASPPRALERKGYRCLGAAAHRTRTREMADALRSRDTSRAVGAKGHWVSAQRRTAPRRADAAFARSARAGTRPKTRWCKTEAAAVCDHSNAIFIFHSRGTPYELRTEVRSMFLPLRESRVPNVSTNSSHSGPKSMLWSRCASPSPASVYMISSNSFVTPFAVALTASHWVSSGTFKFL